MKAWEFHYGKKSLTLTNNTFIQNVKPLCFCLKVINMVPEYKKLWLVADERIEISEP